MNLIVVSNRLPFVAVRADDGTWRVEPGSGGLVTALRPVLENRGGRWIGWTGDEGDPPLPEDLFTGSSEKFGYELIPVALTASERAGYYQGFSNEVVWPLFHDFPSLCRFEPSYWAAYESVNRKFADAAAAHAEPDDFLWVQDYHLMTLAAEVKKRGVTSRMAFFLHIPFPPLDNFLKLPWRFPILQSLLQYDLIGLQTIRDRRNLIQCLRLLFRGLEISGKGPVLTVRFEGRDVRIGVFPISIDARGVEAAASTPDVAAKVRSLREDEPNRKIVLGIDRLDYTKGIPQKLLAFRNALERFPELLGAVTLIQIVVPSREDIPLYAEHKVEIERLVGQINGRFTRSGWVPIHYIYRTLDGLRLPAYYLAADVAFVTPLKDGMNLVAKEYCASQIREDGVLVLSEFAGAAAQLQRGALLVNPYDVEGVASTLARAVALPASQQHSRMRRLRRSIREHDIFWWLDSFLRAAISKKLGDFPRVEDYLPEATSRRAPLSGARTGGPEEGR